ncbi:hypothetical protein FAM09_10915 [Niastella caeni]|uniref:Uncharacterized protein n=1 Tax=Niastella caeni TaxID=2569763 RepID=A0A4S8HXK2_9BACT|nr:hypothetical protein [Niastella caeni]THU40370.1 hypothetical protein FAM09_10915 [Niastella caeni]
MKPIIFCAALMYCSIGWAQQTPIIQFDGAGKIKSTLPEKLDKNDAVKFSVSDSKETFDKYLKKYTAKLKQSQGLLTKLKTDREKLDIMKKVYDIDVADIDKVINQLIKVTTDLYGADTTNVPRFEIADKNYFAITVENTAVGTSSINIAPNDVSRSFPVLPFGSETRINFALTKKDPFKKLVVDWLDATKGDYQGMIDYQVLLQFRAEIKKMAEEISPFAEKARHEMTKLKAEAKGGEKNRIIAKYNPILEDIAQKCSSYNLRIDALINNRSAAVNQRAKKDWMLKWLWYQNSLIPAINPFGFSELGNRPDTTELDILRTKLQVRELYLKNIIEKTTQADSLLTVIYSIKKRMNDIQQTAKQFDENKAKNEEAAIAFRTTSQDLNKGILFVGDTKRTIYWMRHHNAAENFQLINDQENDEYLEKDRVVILAHNLKVNDIASLHLTLTEITNDASLLTEELTPVITELSGALLGVGSSGAVTLDELIKSAEDGMQELIAKMEALREYYKYIDYLLAQTNPPLEIEERIDRSLAYHSEVTNPVKKIKGPKKATYYLKTELVDKNSPDSARINKLPADTFSYRINKLYRIFPMAGITWTPAKFTNVSQDSTSQFSINEESAVKFIVGVKVYLRKTDIRNGKIFTKKDHTGKQLWPSRTSFNLAFDARKPLDNVYTGLGLDIWPGCCVNLGCVFNKYTYKNYKNGEVFQDKKPYRPGFYLGLSTDLSMFTELGKFLNF